MMLLPVMLFLAACGSTDPERGEYVLAEPTSGAVFVRFAGDILTRLSSEQRISTGTFIDAKAGGVKITVQTSEGTEESVRFAGGAFVISQPNDSKYTIAKLAPPRQCIGKEVGDPEVKAASLWGSGKGKFRTIASVGAATVRGTTWRISDRCDGSTWIKAVEGEVEVTDFTKPGFSKLLRTGQHYSTPAKP